MDSSAAASVTSSSIVSGSTSSSLPLAAAAILGADSNLAGGAIVGCGFTGAETGLGRGVGLEGTTFGAEGMVTDVGALAWWVAAFELSVFFLKRPRATRNVPFDCSTF